MALSASPAVAAPASPCDTPATHRIAQVQGSGEATPLPGPDSDPATSEGLFAFARESFKDVKAGDRVLVTGRALLIDDGSTRENPATRSDEPRIRDYNTEYNPPGLYQPDAFRSSDHDPLVIGLTLPG
ncbi:hypothetical protein ABT120_13675 [Nonomuraea angiospora]|uniref:hypothetical protein n=1 Tax=Nonomuraea angiospora TaxID=46172 RepID=UPI00331CDD22